MRFLWGEAGRGGVALGRILHREMVSRLGNEAKPGKQKELGREDFSEEVEAWGGRGVLRRILHRYSVGGDNNVTRQGNVGKER